MGLLGRWGGDEPRATNRCAARRGTPLASPDGNARRRSTSLSIAASRVFLFGVLPLVLAAMHVWLDERVGHRAQRLEVFMLYMLAIGVAGSGIGGFFAHAFLADEVADSIGWPAGSPFQLEVAFANLALGILGILAMNRRDGFRDATVIAVTIFAGGATITHVIDIVETGNLAAGNTVQNAANILRPAVLIWLLLAIRRSASAEGQAEDSALAGPVAGHGRDRGRSGDRRGIGGLQPRLRPGSAGDRGRRWQRARRGRHSTRRVSRSPAPPLIRTARLDAARAGNGQPDGPFDLTEFRSRLAPSPRGQPRPAGAARREGKLAMNARGEGGGAASCRAVQRSLRVSGCVAPHNRCGGALRSPRRARLTSRWSRGWPSSSSLAQPTCTCPVVKRLPVSGVWLLLAALATALCALGAAPHAFANSGLYITLKNGLAGELAPQARIVAGSGENCWNDGHLAPSRSPIVSPGKSAELYTEKKGPGTPCGGRGARGIEIQLNEPGTGCQPYPPGCGWQRPPASPDAYKVAFDPDRYGYFGFNFENSLTTWVPRPDGRGLVCWDTYARTRERDQPTTGFATINVHGDKTCNRAVPANIKSDPSRYSDYFDVSGKVAPEPPPPEDVRGDRFWYTHDTGAIVSLLSTVRVPCDWYVYPKNTSYCDTFDVGNRGKWVLDQVSPTTKVKDFKSTGEVLSLEPKFSLGTVGPFPIPPKAQGGAPATLSVEKTVETGTEAVTTVTHGARVGVEFSWTEKSNLGLKGIAEGGFEATQKLSADYNYSNAKAEATRKREEVKIGVSYPAQPGYTTTLDVFTRHATANYHYDADLEFGSKGAVAPVITPAAQALNMSPAKRHPCLAYVVGDETVRNSIMNIGKAQSDAGYRAMTLDLAPEMGESDPNRRAVSEARRAFMRAIEDKAFKTASEECPGFPAGFASQASFHGSGVGTYENTGYDQNGNPVSAVLGCVYVRPYDPGAGNPQPTTTTPTSTNQTVDQPCQAVQVTENAGKQREAKGTLAITPGSLGAGSGGGSPKLDPRRAGVLIRARGTSTQGTPVSDKVMASDRDEQISTGSGTFEQVHARGGDDLVSGGPGEDLINGGNGGDELDGGGGFDTVHGGDGRDTLREPGGAGSLNGDAGADTLIANGEHEVTMLGGAGDDRLFSRDKSASTLSGGPGDDRFVVTARGKTEVFEMPGEGDDVLRINREVVVPPYTERAVATGGRPVELRSTYGRQTLVGNRAANVLAAGTGSDRVRGGRGGDRILLNELGFDRVTGGDGADSFVPRGTPANADRPSELEDPPHRTAHRITGFHPGRGDRIVMLASVFGRELLEQHREPAIVRDHNPRPRRHRATILFDDRTGLVSIDRDGTGPISDKVAVVLPDERTLNRSWLEVRG